MEDQSTDEMWMDRALELAQKAGQIGEVPVGALIIADGKILGEGHNQPISTNDPTAHAEIVALRAAARQLENYRLPDTTLYVTLEPCMMCANAMVHARVKRLVYGATETKAGAVHSHPLLQATWLNHQVSVSAGVCAEQCGNLLREFFASRRENHKGRSH